MTAYTPTARLMVSLGLVVSIVMAAVQIVGRMV